MGAVRQPARGDGRAALYRMAGGLCTARSIGRLIASRINYLRAGFPAPRRLSSVASCLQNPIVSSARQDPGANEELDNA